MLSLAGDTVVLATPQFLFFAALMAIFALVRPETIRDGDNHRLPYNTGARVTIVVVYLLTYAIVTAAFSMFVTAAQQPIIPTFMISLVEKMNLKDLHLEAPFYAIATLGGLWTVPFFKEIERHFVLRLHDTGHLRGDVDLLAQHLKRCPFNPSATERGRNIEDLKAYGVFVRDDNAEIVDMRNVSNWRKVSSLLRLLREWHREDENSFTADDEQILADVKTAHDRKTHLAMTIIKVIKMMQQGAEGQAASALVAELMRKLSTNQQIDRSYLAEVEAQAKSIIGADAPPSAPQTVRLSAEEFRAYLQEIEKYFEYEYDLLLHRTAILAAKRTVLAGAASAQRLEKLKELGFTGLGHIDRINLDLVLWFFLVTTVGGFVVMSYGLHPTDTPEGRRLAENLARFAATMGVAGLIGTFVGSRRRYARAANPPWTVYFGAGLTAALVYIGAAALHESIRDALGVVRPEGQPAFSIERVGPFSLLPFMVTVSVCYLARVRNWHAGRQNTGYHQYIERAIDGAIVSFAVLVAFYAAVEIYRLVDGDLPANIKQSMDAWHTLPGFITAILPYPFYWPVQILAFLIGFLVVRDVRRVAHSTIVEDNPMIPTAPPRPAVVSAPA